MNDIKRLVGQFRDAIDRANNEGEFETDDPFGDFPLGCCGDTSLLLAQFLLENNIITYYVCGTYIGGCRTHAWLVTDNNSIIDITGDQFKDNLDFLNYNESVYVGAEDDFHRLFKFEESDKNLNEGLDNSEGVREPSLKELYDIILKYI